LRTKPLHSAEPGVAPLGNDLKQPAHPRGFCAQVSAPEVDGICVLGQPSWICN
jgi:hypothetical protein